MSTKVAFLIMKKNTYYFTHDYNAHNDTKILYLRQDLGMEGYGIYWYLIESLADSGGILPLKILPVLARQMDCTLVKVEGIIRNYELFEINENQFFSQRLLSHLDVRKALSEAGKQGANNRWNNGVANGVAIDHPNAKERKGKEIKGKEKKVKNTEFIPPSLSEAKAYFKESGYTEASAERFFNYYNISNWVDSKGNKVKNWKSKAIAIWFKDENKQVEIPEGDRMCEFVSKGNFYNKPVQMKYSIYLFHKSNDQFEGDTKLIKML